jgi:hypothetical protein
MSRLKLKREHHHMIAHDDECIYEGNYFQFITMAMRLDVQYTKVHPVSRMSDGITIVGEINMETKIIRHTV